MPAYQMRKQNPEKEVNFPKVTQLAGSGATGKLDLLYSRVLFLTYSTE